ncbi:MAG TPA: hypothetical protein PKC47_01730 [Petrimonas sp.]|nr:hypothetical protein [Petrimonas sp.]
MKEERLNEGASSPYLGQYNKQATLAMDCTVKPRSFEYEVFAVVSEGAERSIGTCKASIRREESEWALRYTYP